MESRRDNFNLHQKTLLKNWLQIS